MIFQVAAYSHIGKVRSKNDDFWGIGSWVEQNGAFSLEFETSSRFFSDFGLLCAVADGMGGYEGGALAAKTVLDTLSALFYARKHNEMNIAEFASQLESDLSQTQRVLQATLTREGLTEAGTTLAGVAFLAPDIALVFHCGDSRVLRAGGGYVRALTLDHTPLSAQIAAGDLDEESAARSPLASKISRSLGLAGDSRVEIGAPLGFASGDTFLLCSDGFHGLGRGLTLPQLRSGAGRCDVKRWVEEAVECDGRDNATLVRVGIV
jgi:protein phosphatase